MAATKHINHLIKSDPVLAQLILEIELRPTKLRKNYFQSLVRSIVGQQLSVKAAATIMGRVENLFGTKDFPTPEEFLSASDDSLRKAGLSYSKVSYVQNLAHFFIAHAAEIKKIRKMSDEDIIAFLTQIKGVGKWTAEMFLIFSLGREDVFSHADLGLQNAITKAYKLRKKPNQKRLKAISDKWKPYRSHASRYLWESLNLT